MLNTVENKDKYYTPSIEEFRPEFEFQYHVPFSDDKDKWYDVTVDGVNYDIVDGQAYLRKQSFFEYIRFTVIHNPQFIRVKYLDREDIESLGFVEEWIPDCYDDEDEIKLGYAFYLNKNDCILLHLHEDKTVGIVKQHIYNEHSGNWEAYLLFKGIIKNKSELKQVLKMIGVEYENTNS